MSDAVKAMVRIGIRQNRIPFEVTREPEVAGIGMRDGDAKFYGIAKDGTDGRSGVPGGMTIKMSPGTRGTCANGATACASPRTRSPISTWGRPPSSCAYRSTTSKRRRFGKPRLAGTPFARADTNDGLTEHRGINRERPRDRRPPPPCRRGTEPEPKREMRRRCSDMCVTPNGSMHMFTGQVATLIYPQAKPVPKESGKRNVASNLVNLEKRMPK